MYCARVRSGNSYLKLDLFTRDLSIDEICDSCGVTKDANHNFLYCINYNTLRADIVQLIPFECVNIRTIFNSSPRHTDELNLKIQKAVQIFIIGSGRFT